MQTGPTSIQKVIPESLRKYGEGFAIDVGEVNTTLEQRTDSKHDIPTFMPLLILL